MNQLFESIIEKEFEKEFNKTEEINGIVIELSPYRDSLLKRIYSNLLERVLTQVWNEAIEEAARHGECDCDMIDVWDTEKSDALNLIESVECALSRASILKLKIEQHETVT